MERRAPLTQEERGFLRGTLDDFSARTDRLRHKAASPNQRRAAEAGQTWLDSVRTKLEQDTPELTGQEAELLRVAVVRRRDLAGAMLDAGIPDGARRDELISVLRAANAVLRWLRRGEYTQ